MNNLPPFLAQLRDRIAYDEFDTVLQQLRTLLENSPRLDEVLLQSARFHDIRRQIRLGLTSNAEANLTKNKIRAGLLELIGELENVGIAENNADPNLQTELEQAVSIVNSKNIVMGNITAGGNVHLGDHIVIQVNGTHLDLSKLRAEFNGILPQDLLGNLITDTPTWVQSIRRELLKQQGTSVGNLPHHVFEHYGWLIESFLQKMGTPIGQERTLRRLSFLAEAYQSTLRYLCYIQLAQILQSSRPVQHPLLTEFLQLSDNRHVRFDYLTMLFVTGAQLPDAPFMPELKPVLTELANPDSELLQIVLFLDRQRQKLLDRQIAEDESLATLLDEYLTALVSWLRRLAFLARYRLVSIKDINLNYRLGTTKKFVHVYGQLHGMYNEVAGSEKDYEESAVEDEFTYNHSVLLFRGNNVMACLNNIQDTSSYLSLSPLLIDQSVFAAKITQTPEIYYFIGQSRSPHQYQFAQYKNELSLGANEQLASNKILNVRQQNNDQPKLDELYEHLELLFKPFKSPLV